MSSALINAALTGIIGGIALWVAYMVGLFIVVFFKSILIDIFSALKKKE